jgi:hypothetical protein
MECLKMLFLYILNESGSEHHYGWCGLFILSNFSMSRFWVENIKDNSPGITLILVFKQVVLLL